MQDQLSHIYTSQAKFRYIQKYFKDYTGSSPRPLSLFKFQKFMKRKIAASEFEFHQKAWQNVQSAAPKNLFIPEKNRL